MSEEPKFIERMPDTAVQVKENMAIVVAAKRLIDSGKPAIVKKTNIGMMRAIGRELVSHWHKLVKYADTQDSTIWYIIARPMTTEEKAAREKAKKKAKKKPDQK